MHAYETVEYTSIKRWKLVYKKKCIMKKSIVVYSNPTWPRVTAIRKIVKLASDSTHEM